MQPLHKYKFLVAYTDPSYKKKGDYKATALIGKYKDEYHVIKMFCDKTTVAKMLDWNYQIKAFVGDKTPVFYYIEYPWIDDALKIEIAKANIRHKTTLVPKADERDKPDKFYRIEANLEPINRAGKLIFNQDLQGSEDMDNTEGQFLALSPTSRANDDAPDAVEGGHWVFNDKINSDMGKIDTKKHSRTSTSKHY